MKKQLLPILLLLGMLAIISACNNSAIQSDSSDADESDANGNEEETVAEGQEEGEDTIKIGNILPFSGVYATLGKDLSDGMKLYFDQIDWEVEGTKIVTVEEDTEADPQTALRKTRKLIQQDEVDILSGAVSTAVAYAIRDEVDSNKIPYLAAHAGGNDLTREQRSDYIWRSSFSSWQIGHSMGEWAYENVGDKMYVAAADYAFGQEVSAAFMEAYEEAGGEIVGEVYPPLGNNDYASYLTTISGEEADGVYAFFAGSDAVRFVQQFEEYGLKDDFKLVGSGWLVSEDLRESIGSAAEGTYASTFWDYNVETEENQQFVSDFEEAYDRRPTIEALEGYDAAQIIAETIKELDGDVSNPDEVIETLSNVEIESPRGPIRFDKDTHHIIQNMYIVETKTEGDRTENEVIETIEEVQDPGE